LKEIRRIVSSSFYTIPFLLLVYVLIVAVSFILAGIGFGGMFSADFFSSPRALISLVAGPIGVIIFLGIFLFSAITEILHREGPSRFRLRAFALMSVLVVLASFPPAVIMARYVGAVAQTWFDSSISDSLAAADDIAMLYLKERGRTVANTARNFLNGPAIEKYRQKPSDWLSAMRAMDPDAAACQVYLAGSGPDGATYAPVIESGDLGRFVPRVALGEIRNGFFSLPGDAPDVNRYGQIVRYGNRTYVCAYASLVPVGFGARRELIAHAREHTKPIDAMKPYVPFMGVWIFMMFCLPILLMTLIVAWAAAARIATPVRLLSDSVARFGGADSDFFTVPHTRDECADMARNLNSLGEK
jgi:nitrogen fixation/metabolism regulation signal transduction histidine kinase